MRLQKPCTICNKPLVLQTKWAFGEGETLNFYKCGHVFTKSHKLFKLTEEDFTSLDGRKTAYEYQKQGIDFGLNESNISCLIADQMGLGKTMQGLLILRKWRETNPDGIALIAVKSATTWQWFQQYKVWSDPSLTGIFLCGGSKMFLPPGFKTYVMSMDTLGRMVKTETSPAGRTIHTWIDPMLKNLNIKFLIVDECQSFKDTSSKRTQALVTLVKELNIENKIFLSGTPIKNRADEYFTVLNILDPEEFYSIEAFRRRWLQQDTKGKWSTIHPHKESAFREHISQYVIRREVKDVMKDLPPFRRTFETIHIDDENIKAAYNKELAKLQETVESEGNYSYMDVEASLMTLRRITGYAKVSFAAEYIDTFLDSSFNGSAEKIAIGIHHKSVRDSLYGILKERGINVLKLSGEDTAQEKFKIVEDFKKPENRVIIINMLSGGVGMDGLQVCNNVLCLERQWNSVDEEQFEARFWRNGQMKPVLAEYMIAKGTIDEYFSELVESKRWIFGKTVGNEYSIMSDRNMLRDLVERTILGKLK